MATVTVRHKVADIGKWKDGHQDRLEIFAPAMTSYQSFQDVGDPKNQHIKDKHTVLEPIIISLPITF